MCTVVVYANVCHFPRLVFARKGCCAYRLAHSPVAVCNEGVEIIALCRCAVGPGYPCSCCRAGKGMNQFKVTVNLKLCQSRQYAAVNIVCWRSKDEHRLSQTRPCLCGRKERNGSRCCLCGNLCNLYLAYEHSVAAGCCRVMEAGPVCSCFLCREIILGCNAAKVEQKIPVEHAESSRICALSKGNGHAFAL